VRESAGERGERERVPERGKGGETDVVFKQKKKKNCVNEFFN
jgi:hypothetical protein